MRDARSDKPLSADAAQAAAAFAAAKGGEGLSAAEGSPRVQLKQIVWLVACVGLFALSVAGSVVLWQTSLWDDHIDSRLVIRNGTQAFEGWSNSRVTAVIKYWIFNYTNAEAFFDGRDAKLRVQEVGPYAFRERVRRVNVVFNDNDTVTFQEHKEYTFLPALSNGSYADRITSLNIVYLSINYLRARMSFMDRLSAFTTVKLIKPKPLDTRPARDWLWGYKDALTAVAELKEGPIKNGLLQSANGTQPERLTIRTGAGAAGVAGLGLITRYNGAEAMDFYGDDECDRVDGSDGARFPPPSLVPGTTIFVYHREACRRVPLMHTDDVKVWDGVPAMRFTVPRDLFADGAQQPDNACYCANTSLDRCFPSGVINTHHCMKGAPLFASFPHFLHGDPVLQEAVDGLRPDADRHRTFVDIHQRVGATVGLMSRFQMSLLATDGFGDPLLRRLDGLILPWVWTERALEDFPEDLRATFRLLSFVAPAVHATLLWACPLLAALSGLALLLCLYVEAAALARGSRVGAAPAAPDDPLPLDVVVAAKDELTHL